jgi:hypothetical protein
MKDKELKIEIKWLCNAFKNEPSFEDYIKNNVFKVKIGEPKSTKYYTSQEMKSWGMVGVYKVIED